MRAKLKFIFGLFRMRCLLYVLFMASGMNLFGGAHSPGFQPPAPNAYARSIQKKAGSQTAADLREVSHALTSKQELLRLNTAQEYAQLTGQDLTILPVLAILSRNPSPDAHEIFALLCENKEFLAEPSRVESLLLTLPKVRSLPIQALPLLRKSVEPDAGSPEIAIRALFEIGDKSTLDIFAAQLLGGRQDPEAIPNWFRDPLLRHRREPAVLQMCLGLLQNPKFDADLKNALVEALYDYRPAEWYISQAAGAAPPPKPPVVRKLSPASRELLKKIAVTIAADPAISARNKALAGKN